MQEIMRINVKYTMDDIKKFSITQSFLKVTGILGILLSCFLLFGFSIYMAIMILFLAKEDIPFVLMMTPGFLFTLIPIAPSCAIYLTSVSNFKKSRLLHKPQCYVLCEEGLYIRSENGRMLLKWSDIKKIEELRPCFLIVDAHGLYRIIPRRCFCDEKQLFLFREAITTMIPRERLSIGNYLLGKTVPDVFDHVFDTEDECDKMEKMGECWKAGGVDSTAPDIHTTEVHSPEDEMPLFSISFGLVKNDYVKVLAWNICTSITVCIMVAIGLWILYVFTGTLVQQTYTEDSMPVAIAALLFGAFLVCMPFAFLILSTKNISKGRNFPEQMKYSFYEQYFIVNGVSGESRIQWNDLVKIRSKGPAYQFYTTAQIANVIPKSAFAKDKEAHKALQELISRKRAK